MYSFLNDVLKFFAKIKTRKLEALKGLEGQSEKIFKNVFKGFLALHVEKLCKNARIPQTVQ